MGNENEGIYQGLYSAFQPFIAKIICLSIEFVQWYPENGKRLDGGARSEFVAEKVRDLIISQPKKTAPL